jgi:hypothetical protein
MTFIFLGGKLKMLINTGELMDCKNNVDEDFCHSRSQWPHSLRRGPAVTRLLGFQFRIPPKAWMSVVSVVFCQAQVSATGRSLVQRSLPRAYVIICNNNLDTYKV